MFRTSALLGAQRDMENRAGAGYMDHWNSISKIYTLNRAFIKHEEVFDEALRCTQIRTTLLQMHGWWR
jgi:hypothetical protein